MVLVLVLERPTEQEYEYEYEKPKNEASHVPNTATSKLAPTAHTIKHFHQPRLVRWAAEDNVEDNCSTNIHPRQIKQGSRSEP
jgi:hypothetical protein